MRPAATAVLAGMLLFLAGCGVNPGPKEDAEWKAYAGPDQSFEAKLPAPPQHKEVPFPHYLGKLIVHDWGYERPFWRGSFVVSYCNIPAKATFDLKKGTEGIKSKLQSMGFSVHSDEATNYRGNPARCLQISRYSQSGEAIVFHTGDTRVYTLIAVGGTPKERGLFTSSFQWHLTSTRANDLAMRPKIGESPEQTAARIASLNSSANPAPNPAVPGTAPAEPPPEPPAESPPPPPPPAPEPPPPPDTTWVDACLDELRSSNTDATTDALARFQANAPADRKEDILRAVESLLLSPTTNARLRHLCLNVLETHATLTCVPALEKAIRSGESFTTDRAMQILGKLGSPDAFRTLTRCLGDPNLRARTAGILKDAGPRSEPYLWNTLDDNDPKTRAEACRILGDIGSDRSLSHLQPLLADPDFSVKTSAQRASDAIAGRKGKAPGAPSTPSAVPGKKWY